MGNKGSNGKAKRRGQRLSSCFPTLKPLMDQDDWWKPLIYAFLPPCDALSLSATCTQLHLVQVMDVKMKHSGGDWNGHYDGSSENWQPIPLKYPTLGVYITFRWRDQGWGNQKGMFAVVQGDALLPGDFIPFGDEVVTHVFPAEHHWKDVKLSFRPQWDAWGKPLNYTIWLRIGGGGGHALTINNLCIRTVVYKDNSCAAMAADDKEKEEEGPAACVCSCDIDQSDVKTTSYPSANESFAMEVDLGAQFVCQKPAYKTIATSLPSTLPATAHPAATASIAARTTTSYNDTPWFPSNASML